MSAGQLAPLSANASTANGLSTYLEDEKLQQQNKDNCHQQHQRKEEHNQGPRRQGSTTIASISRNSRFELKSALTMVTYNNNTSATVTKTATETPATSPKPPTIGAAATPSHRDPTFGRDVLPSPQNRPQLSNGETQKRWNPRNYIEQPLRTNSDASGRSAALERAYVHDVYENCDEPAGPVRPKVAQFLTALDPGSIVCDVGCGSGRYLTQCNPSVCMVGVDRCHRLSKLAHEKGGEVAVCDNLELPFRDESFDAVLSLAVVHHFATTERRVNAIRELARILRIGGRVIITVWALEQRHRRFESQDVLIPWQPPKARIQTCSDEEEEDDSLPPYNAYTEDSTNSSRSAGDGDSSSLSSSSPGESCYSFVRRALQKLAGNKRQPWFLDSWTSKDAKNHSSLDYEDAKDLPIELRRLEDFEDFPEPPLSAGLKSRSLGSILNPPPRQIVRSRSSVPSLGAQMKENKQLAAQTSPGQVISICSTVDVTRNSVSCRNMNTSSSTTTASSTPPITSKTLCRRPKLIKQKQSLCDEDDSQLPDNSFHNISNVSSNTSLNSNNHPVQAQQSQQLQSQPQPPKNSLRGFVAARQFANAKLFLRKQSSLNEELMVANRIREKERIRKRIQKQMSLNEAFLCRSMLTKRLQLLRDGFTNKLKLSTGTIERATKNGFVKILQNFKSTTSSGSPHTTTETYSSTTEYNHNPNDQDPTIRRQCSVSSSVSSDSCNYVTATASATTSGSSTNGCEDQVNNSNNNSGKPRRHSRESGSDSSKDSSLQSDTSIESEDSFASVIFIPKPDAQQQSQTNQTNGQVPAQKHQQKMYHQQNSNSSSSNSNSSCNGDHSSTCNSLTHNTGLNNSNSCKNRIPSVPTSPLVMPCPPTPAHSPAAAYTIVTSPPQSVSTVQAAMSMLTPPKLVQKTIKTNTGSIQVKPHFTFDEEHIQQLEVTNPQEHSKIPNEQKCLTTIIIDKPLPTIKLPPSPVRITRQSIKDLPPIPKFRKHYSLQKPGYAIVRRSSPTNSSVPKLISLELFNPLTDDVDSDSSEPSSPDSIDSVISAPKSKDTIYNTDQDDPLTADYTLKPNNQLNGMSASMENLNLNDDTLDSVPHPKVVNKIHNATRAECVEFAEQLSAQLMRELDEKNRCDKIECRSLDGIGGDIGDYIDDPVMTNFRKRTSDLTALRDELRERRLMLANLSTQHSLQPSPNSSSTSSLSSQTRSLTIHEEHEEEEEEREEAEGNSSNSYSLNIYENYKVSKFKYKRNRQYTLNPETAYLLEDGDSSAREDDDDVILEEDEDVKSDEGVLNEEQPAQPDTESYALKTTENTIKCDDVPIPPEDQDKKDNCNVTNNRQSTIESNSSNASLESPTQGGASTHHRYYHVFREGELDALINHHVASLHIVSSYYERASWCVVAEKVHVWSI